MITNVLPRFLWTSV